MAIRYWKQAAAAGYTPATLSLGMLYASRGEGWSDYYRRLYYRRLLEKAEQSGSPAASNALGIISWQTALHEGAGFAEFRKKDFAVAISKFKKDAALGSCDALLNLGGMSFDGDGVPQDAAEARSWFVKARDCPGASLYVQRTATKFLKKLQAAKPLPL